MLRPLGRKDSKLEITIHLRFANGEKMIVQGDVEPARWWERLFGKPLIVKVRTIVGGLGEHGAY